MKKKSFITILSIFVFLLIVLVLVVFVIPTLIEKKAQKAEKDAYIAEENARLAIYNNDMQAMINQEFDGIFLSMQDSSEWNMDIFSGYIGKNLFKVNAPLKTSDEVVDAWYNAELSENVLTYCVFIIDPFKLYEGKEGEDGTIVYNLSLAIEDIFANNPNTEFRVFMPFYDIDYWEGYTEETFAMAVEAYSRVLRMLCSYDNVTTSCFTGYDWLVKNPKLFGKNGGLSARATEAFFLYNYRDYWQVTLDKIDGIIDTMNSNLWFENPVEPKKHWYDAYKNKETVTEIKYEFEGFEDCDVIFLGDSLFALFDGPFSIPSYFENFTGARVYNLSRGGLTTAKYYEEVPSMPELIDYVIEGKATGITGFDVFDRDVLKFAQDDHTGRRLIIITDFGTNDYLFGAPVEGEAEDCYHGALKAGISKLQKAYSEAEILGFSVYHILDCNNGENLNDYGKVLDDYRSEMKTVCEAVGVSYLDMKALSPISDENAGYYLDDGLHPSMAGSYELSRILCENIK